MPDKNLQRWVTHAESLTPVLSETLQSPIRVVKAIAAPETAMGYRMETDGDIARFSERSFTDGDSFILDFGGHRTGGLSFFLDWEGRGVDAPARLRLTFGEVPSDVAESAYPHQGWLSGAWIPDELINVDFLPRNVTMPRRYAFRYVKVEVIYTSRNFNVVFRNFQAHALTSAGNDLKVPSRYRNELLGRIDQVALATLRDCMQTTFEDGPKRDQRLWIGDLRLQALANYESYNNLDLVKRCLYLFAGLPREDGFLTACVYEKPFPRVGQETIMDYAALYCCSVLEYYQASEDLETAKDLWPVVRRQIDLLSRYVNADGLFVEPENFWIFIDWREDLHKQAAMHGVLIYTYRKVLELARIVGCEDEVSHFPKQIESMVVAARAAFYDEELKCFVSGADRQVSWASQVWLSLANVVDPVLSAQALKRVMTLEEAVKPQTPYLYHYMVEALFVVGEECQAQQLIETYWGAMLEAGADTFWEAYDTEDPLTSPYGSKYVNSYCHAWSCTPTYFIRKYLAMS